MLSANEPLARDARWTRRVRRQRATGETVNEEKGYEFLFPNEYLADQTVAERRGGRRAKSVRRAVVAKEEEKSTTGEPESAFGPMGTNGEEKYERYRAKSIKGFDLSEFGNAEKQANWLLENALARPRSWKRGDVGLHRRETVRMESNIINSSIRLKR